jgi:hypothetical protein
MEGLAILEEEISKLKYTRYPTRILKHLNLRALSQ